jgi:hypothetical protein
MIQIIQLDGKRRELDIYVPFVVATDARYNNWL